MEAIALEVLKRAQFSMFSQYARECYLRDDVHIRNSAFGDRQVLGIVCLMVTDRYGWRSTNGQNEVIFHRRHVQSITRAG